MNLRWFAAAIVCGTIAAVVIVLLRREPPLDKLAMDICEESLAGKTDRLFAYAFLEEIERCGYTRANIHELWSKVIMPSLSGYREVGRSREWLGPHGGYASIVLQNSQGRQSGWSSVAWQTEEGPKVSISTFLLKAWWASSSLTPRNSRNAREASLAGLRRDRATLERLGIRGLANADPSTGEITFRDWDTFERDLVQRLAEEDAKRPK